MMLNAPMIRQIMSLGILLERRNLDGVSPNDFADWELRDIITQLKKNKTDGLASYLKRIGVPWDKEHRSADAVLTACAKHGQRHAARRIAEHAYRSGVASPKELLQQIAKRVLDDTEESNTRTETGDRS